MSFLKCATEASKSLVNGYKKNSPEILTGLGLAGMLLTVVLAVRATPKAMERIEKKKKELKTDKLSTADTVKATWTCYVPTALSGVASSACIIGGQSINKRRNTALATAYTMTETALKEYQEKVIETVGEKKERDVRDAIAKEHLEREPLVNKEIIITGGGETRCFDTFRARRFKSDIEKLRRVENELNKRLLSEMFISLNEYYYEIGLSPVKDGDDIGWYIEDGLIDMEFSAQLDEDGVPCLVVDYRIAPRPDFRSLH